MYITHSNNHQHHRPRYEIFNGLREPHQEVPARVESIAQALDQAGYALDSLNSSITATLLNSIHNADYLSFLESASGNQDYQYPAVFPLRSSRRTNYQNRLVQHGLYSFDLFTPILENTYQIAFESASLAYQAADYVLQNEEHAYALCRPPGHHAEVSQMGGYCYLNNAALAAEHLSGSGSVATLDVDFHHGNGTQHIFYERSDILTTSIHADPNRVFPYWSGFTNEVGEGQGKGLNHNFPLELGTDNDEYQRILEKALSNIQDFDPDYLVVSFGADTYNQDPIGGFNLTTNYYEQMAQTINQLNIPTLIIQEGGYNVEALGANVVSFLRGFKD